MSLTELVWSNNTASGRLIILLILFLGAIGCLCAWWHWRRYRVIEHGWLNNVRTRLRNAHTDLSAAVATPVTPDGGDEPAAVSEPSAPSPAPLSAVDLRVVAQGVPVDTLIGDRLSTILRMDQARVRVDVDALQQGTILKESARWTLSFPAYAMGLLMMLGLLGTFIGLSFMVADIQRALPDPNAQADAARWADSVSSLGRILAGKKTAFSATLTGLFFSIVVSAFNFALARAQSRFYDAMERFTTEELLPAAFVAYDDETPWEKLSRQLGDSFERLQELVGAQTRSAEQMAAVETTFGTVLTNIETMTQRAATAPLQGVTGEMTGVIGQLAQVNGAIVAIAERLPQVVTAFQQTHQTTLREIQASMHEQRGAVDRLTQALRAAQSLSSRWSFGFAAAGATLVVLVIFAIQRLG